MERLDGRFRVQAARDLERMTRTGLPPDPGLWRDWWLANRDEVLAGVYSPGSVRWPDGARPTVFFDVPVHSTRVCFLVDRSRSMRLEGRFADAKRELVRLLGDLPDGSLVNIVFFGGSQSVLWKGSRTLDAAARREAADFVERAGLEDATDLYGGLLKALQFTGSLETGRLREDGLDTIVVLSDGKATWGRVVDEDLLAATVSRKAGPLGPVIHGVSVGGESRALRLLAERTGGEYRVR
jgi:Mg-chelatase subunit ChlD